MKKWVLCILLTLCMLTALLPTVAFAQDEAAAKAQRAAENGTAAQAEGILPIEPATDANGVYQIDTKEKLYWFADFVNRGGDNAKADARLTASITVNTGVSDQNDDDSNFTVWMPIGSTAAPYIGTFEGQGYTINGLYCKLKGDYAGLFGSIGEGGTVQNVRLARSYFYGDSYVGSVCGQNNGSIIGCINTSAVRGSYNFIGGVCGQNEKGKITGCTNTATVTGSFGGSGIGGICGYNRVGSIIGCSNTGAVTGNTHIGGVCGNNTGILTGCFNEGDATSTRRGDATSVGGVAGVHGYGGIMTACYNTGTVSCTDSNNYYLHIGGVCGAMRGDGAWMIACFNKGTVKNTNGKAGGVCGDNYSGSHIYGGYFLYGTAKQTVGTGAGTDIVGSKTAAEFKGKAASGSNVLELLNDALIKKEQTGVYFYQGTSYPVPALKPAQDENGVYQIGTKEELYWFAGMINGTLGVKQEFGANAVLTANITVNTGVLDNDGEPNPNIGGRFVTWKPIGSSPDRYAGTFDGQGHTISGLYCNGSGDYVGLFGFIASAGTIKNVTVARSYFKGNNFTAGICGYNNAGIIQGCTFTGTIDGEESWAGGICGSSYGGKIIDCTNTGMIRGSARVGGICGSMNGADIERCKNFGTVTSTGDYAGGVSGIMGGFGRITGSYNTGAVSGVKQVGGVCGNSSYGKVIGCYNTGDITGSGDAVGGVNGYSMQNTRIIGSFNFGKVSGVNSVGGVSGENRSGSSIVNSYYNSDVYTGKAVGTENDAESTTATGKTAAQFKDGAVCKALNAALKEAEYEIVFYQGDDYPVLTAPIVFEGIEDGGTYCRSVTFAVQHAASVTANGGALTADEQGQYTLSANGSNKVYTILAKDGSTEKQITVTVNADHIGGIATCTQRATCTVCGEQYGETDPENHTGDTEVRGYTEATCTVPGYTGDTYCKACGERIAQDGKPIPAPGHDWEETEYTWSGTECTAKRICKRDANHVETESVTAVVTVTQQRTCVLDELSTYTATFINPDFSAQVMKNVKTAERMGHDFTVLQSDETEHWYRCSRCEAIDAKAAHTGGEASCHALAVCEVCEKAYGALNPDNHTDGEVWRLFTKTHKKICVYCDAVIVPEEKHTCKDSVCNECGYHCYQHEGGTASYFVRPICEICGEKYGFTLSDSTKPTGKLCVAGKEWDELLSSVTFGLFFRDAQAVRITAEDDSYTHPGFDSSRHAVKIAYYIHTGEGALRESELEEKAFTAYTGEFNISPSGRYVIYARLTDYAGNITYLSSDGIVLDDTAPELDGIADGGIYCGAKTVAVKEANLASVTVNGEAVTLDENNAFVLSPAQGAKTVTATDAAGNSVTVTVTINETHSYGWKSEDGQYWKKCSVCGDETEKKEIPVIPVSGADEVCRTQDCRLGFSLPGGCTFLNAEYCFEDTKGTCTVIADGGAYIAVIDGKTAYLPNESMFTVRITAQTEDGFGITAEKTVKIIDGHRGGAANCHAPAVCEVCGNEYGEKNPENHDGGTELRGKKAAGCTESGYTGDTYCLGCEALLQTGEEIPAAGHKGGAANCHAPSVCEVCGNEYGEKNPENHDGGTELRGQKAAGCTESGYTGDTYCLGCEALLQTGEEIPAAGHKGGAANCHAPAVCEVCQNEYGEKNPENHDGGTEIRGQKAAGCTENGYTGDTYCLGCEEKLQTGEVIPATGHNYVNGDCTKCGAEDPNAVCDGGEGCPGKHFTDMPSAQNWAHAGIDYAVKHSLFAGMSETTFGADITMTRGMLVRVLWKMAGSPAHGEENPFSDLKASDWFYDGAVWAAEHDIMVGVGDGVLLPNEPVSREQLAAILYRYSEMRGEDVSLRADLSVFPDAADVSDWALDALAWANANEFVCGTKEEDAVYLRPQSGATRAQVAAILMRYCRAAKH